MWSWDRAFAEAFRAIGYLRLNGVYAKARVFRCSITHVWTWEYIK